MEFTLAAKKEKKAADYRVTRIETIARYFWQKKVAMNGQRFEGEGAWAKYVAAISKLKPAELEQARDFATKLAREAYERKQEKLAGNRGSMTLR